jgi:hypothetical protein
MVWAKWYMWCESCLRGIYCPLGSFRVPKSQSYLQWGDKVALKQALPPGLKLIQHPRIEQQSQEMAFELPRIYAERGQFSGDSAKDRG